MITGIVVLVLCAAAVLLRKWLGRRTRIKEQRCLVAFDEWEKDQISMQEWTYRLTDMFNSGQLPLYIHRSDLGRVHYICGTIRAMAITRRKGIK